MGLTVTVRGTLSVKLCQGANAEKLLFLPAPGGPAGRGRNAFRERQPWGS